ncbi:hypothetical protein DMS56_03630 [Klebsiella variicola]|nr:hypothetical protein [Klebsiella sp. HSTU-Sny5]PXL26052.1 hypothetical protein DMS66_06835 [Klebsiella variicola]HBZ0994365.1 hypothetical protein [Klebsiella pneumoniae]PXL48077.1 hypothetical protein DMS47_01405 [Klebsiella variicola]PXL74000.1 hypothetical protein DMS56_03630 [Klebsiella variicola]
MFQNLVNQTTKRDITTDPLGSNVAEVVRHAECSVLVVR